MRGQFVLFSSAAIACLAIALTSAPIASPQIICPMAGGAGPPIATCCGPPVAQPARAGVMPIGCCPGNAALCISGLSIGSTPDPSIAPRKVVITGRLLSGAQGSSGPVVVWERLPGQRQFHQLLQRTPDSSGQYTATVVPRTNREWYATANGLRSITVQQQVQAAVTLAASATKSGSVMLSGRVTPSHARERVMIEARSGGGWTVIARPRLDKHSRWRMSLFAKRGVLRALLRADSRNVQSSSAPVTVH